MCLPGTVKDVRASITRTGRILGFSRHRVNFHTPATHAGPLAMGSNIWRVWVVQIHFRGRARGILQIRAVIKRAPYDWTDRLYLQGLMPMRVGEVFASTD
jgi:hypothetical protein